MKILGSFQFGDICLLWFINIFLPVHKYGDILKAGIIT